MAENSRIPISRILFDRLEAIVLVDCGSKASEVVANL